MPDSNHADIRVLQAEVKQLQSDLREDRKKIEKLENSFARGLGAIAGIIALGGFITWLLNALRGTTH